MNLVDVYSVERFKAVDLLWSLLVERPPEANISHRQMPSFTEHINFVASRPYLAWYLIEANLFIGAVYLTQQREIGVGILHRHQRRGYGEQAIQMLMERHPGRFLANVAPGNTASHRLFQRLGGKVIQHTYELGAA